MHKVLPATGPVRSIVIHATGSRPARDALNNPL